MVFAILIASAVLVPMMPQTAVNISEINQLKMAAQKIMAQLTLNPGNPPDWGSNITITSNGLTAFGLAKYREIARAAYVLDPDKVQRLDSRGVPSPLYMPPSRIVELLNLGHDYGIRLEFVSALNINLSVREENGIIVKVNVTSEYSSPIAGVNITARVFSLQNGQIIKSSTSNSYTGIDGTCTIEFGDVGPDASLIVVLADYHGVQMVETRERGGFLKSYFIGSYLILDNQHSVGGDVAYQVVAFKSGGEYVIDYVQCSLSRAPSSALSNYNAYYMGPVEQCAVAVLAVTNEGKLSVACKSVPSSYSSTSGEEVYPPLAYTLENSVKIGSSVYTLKLKIWRVSW